MWPPQVTRSSWGQLAQGAVLIEGPWVEEMPYIQILFMTGFEPLSRKVINQGGNIFV